QAGATATLVPVALATVAPAAAVRQTVTAPAAARPNVSAPTAAAAAPAPAAVVAAREPPLPPVADVAARVRPAVAFIAVRAASARGVQGAQPPSGVGSGAIVDGRGYVVTNNHVVEGAQQIRVVLPDGRA